MTDSTGVTDVNGGEPATESAIPSVDRLIEELYPELKRIARSRLRRGAPLTLMDTTSLVHETWLRLSRQQGIALSQRGHFLAYAARAMRSIVVDHARKQQSDKRGGDAAHLEIEEGLQVAAPSPTDDVVRISIALDVLERLDPALARLVELRYFAGMTEDEAAEVLSVSKRTVSRDWKKARALLLEAMG